MRRVLLPVTIAWFAVVLFLPVDPGTSVAPALPYPDGLQFIVPSMILAAAAAYERWPAHRYWGLLSTRWLLRIGMVVLTYLGVAWILDLGFGMSLPTVGSYNTEGVLLLVFINIVVLMNGRIGGPRAWFLGAGIVFAVIGFWETLYQVSVWSSFYHRWFPQYVMLRNEILYGRPHPLMGIPFLVLMVYYGWRFGWRWKWLTLVPAAVFTGFWFAWYYIGDFWVIWYADYTIVPPINGWLLGVWLWNRPIEWFWYLGARGSKVIMSLAFMLLASGIGGRSRPLRWAPAVLAGLTLVMLFYLVLRPH